VVSADCRVRRLRAGSGAGTQTFLGEPMQNGRVRRAWPDAGIAPRVPPAAVTQTGRSIEGISVVFYRPFSAHETSFTAKGGICVDHCQLLGCDGSAIGWPNPAAIDCQNAHFRALFARFLGRRIGGVRTFPGPRFRANRRKTHDFRQSRRPRVTSCHDSNCRRAVCTPRLVWLQWRGALATSGRGDSPVGRLRLTGTGAAARPEIAARHSSSTDTPRRSPWDRSTCLVNNRRLSPGNDAIERRTHRQAA
jgi:hypothetical protein